MKAKDLPGNSLVSFFRSCKLKMSTQEEKREKWDNTAQFFLATLGFCVGMGALTRFPYLCMRNGGGAFLIPFVIFMIAAGGPLFYIELILGQFSGRSPLTLFKSISPAFKGVGLSATLLSGIVCLYYLPLTWSLFYLVSSCSGPVVPWATCDNPWNTERCYDPWLTRKNLNDTLDTAAITNRASPAEEFWNEYILGISTSLEDIGNFRWQLVLSHAVCWFAVFLCTMGGASTAGKVVYVTATLPFALITILLGFGLSLEGSFKGIEFFLLPVWEKLLDPNVWIEAAIQVIFQLGPAWGGCITMASYNKFDHKCYRDAWMITALNFFTAIYGGLAIFAILGFMANRYGVPVSEVAKSGPGLAFVAYPEAIAQMPFSPLWAVIFFLTLITVGIDSQFGMFDTLVGGILDSFPKLRRYKVAVTAAFAFGCFTLGLPFCTNGGMYIYQLVDWYSAPLTFSVIALAEVVLVSYVYGVDRFCEDAALMFGFKPSRFVKILWLSVTPVALLILVFVGVWNVQPPTYQYTNYKYPKWAIAFGWVVGLISFLPTPVFLIWTVIRTPGSFVKRMRKSFKPMDDWLPCEPDLVEEYKKRWYKVSLLDIRNTEENTDEQSPPDVVTGILECTAV